MHGTDKQEMVVSDPLGHIPNEYRQGHLARDRGKGRGFNPYAPRTESNRLWNTGWIDRAAGQEVHVRWADQWPPAVQGSSVDALEKALYLACCTLAFIGRDQGSDRIDGTLDGLCKMAMETEQVIRAALASAPAPQGELREALTRLRPPFRVDGFNEVLVGEDTLQAMIVRDEEPGCASILAQNMRDQDAHDIVALVNAAALSASSIRQEGV